MDSFAFRNDFPKNSREPSWDRKEVAGALKEARSVMGPLSPPKRQVLGAAAMLESHAGTPAKKFSRKWSDNRDREVLADQLRKKAYEE